MIDQSKNYSNSCLWFTTLVSKQSTLVKARKLLSSLKVAENVTIEMKQGNKISRILAWTFHSTESQERWIKNRWNKLQ